MPGARHDLGDILGCPVADEQGRRLGYAVDARFVHDGPVSRGDNPHSPDSAGGADGAGLSGSVVPAARLHGFIVSPHTRSSFLGYARTNVNASAALAWILARRHRGSFLVLWPDVATITWHGISLRQGFTKYRPSLHESQGN
ncbi:PRC-barrel domain containing protein [Paenarthrobacter sp. Z7-10]|nr:PRC-barrel domain containing protein [Paenarthrobacter sp. Z7-10]